MVSETTKSAVGDYVAKKIDRRTFLITSGVFTGSIALGSLLSYYYKASKTPPVLSRTQDKIIETTHEHLFPKTVDAPGATDINTTTYLHFVLNDPDMDSDNKSLIINGIGWLEEECQADYDQSFVKLSYDEKESILRKIEKESWGRRWISINLLYIFEALLSDPLYGGNPDGIGWKWLEHDPGSPRPNENNMYGKI